MRKQQKGEKENKIVETIVCIFGTNKKILVTKLKNVGERDSSNGIVDKASPAGPI